MLQCFPTASCGAAIARGKNGYDSTHTPNSRFCELMALAQSDSFAAVTFVIATSASMGIARFQAAACGSWQVLFGVAILPTSRSC